MQKPNLKNETQLSDSELWAISLSAMLTQYNRDRHDQIRFHDHSESYEKQCRMDFKRDWGISSEEELLKELEDLGDTRSETTPYCQYKDNTSRLTLQEKENIIRDPQLSALQAHEPDRSGFLFDAYHNVLDRVGKDAWNDGRSVWICRVALDAGYISEEKAWEEIFKIAKRCANHYNSWEEFGLSYAAGYQEWKPSGFKHHDVDGTMFDLRYLLLGENSPWRHISWEAGQDLLT